MGIIRLMVLLFVSNRILWGEFILDIPKNITTYQLEHIVRNGWSEENRTLNRLIVEHAEKVMPELTKRISRPYIKGKTTLENPFQVPTILLRKEDYQFIIAYTKYLESKGSVDTSLKMYTAILRGLKHTKDDSLLYVIYTLVAEGIVREGVDQLLKTDIDFSKHSHYLEQIEHLLTKDTSAFFEAMEREKKALSIAWSQDLYRKFVVEKYHTDYSNLMKDISKKIEKYNYFLYKEMFKAMKKETPEAIKTYAKQIRWKQKMLESFQSRIRFYLSALWVNIKSSLGMEVEDFGYMSQYLAQTLVCVATPKIEAIYTEYLEHIQKNKQFIANLKKLQQYKPYGKPTQSNIKSAISSAIKKSSL